MINNNCHKTNVISLNLILKSFFFSPKTFKWNCSQLTCFDFPRRHNDANHTGVSFYWALHEWLGAWSNSKLLWYVRVKEWRPCWSLSNNHEFDVRAFRVGSWELFPWQTVAHVNLYNGLALNALDCPCWSLFIA